MTTETPDYPPPPDDLSQAGRDLYEGIHSRFEVLPWEAALVIEAARAISRAEVLAAIDEPPLQTNRHGETVAAGHIVEARQQQIVASRLIASLRLPEDTEEGTRRPQRRGAARGSYGIRGVV